jgi:hypothetical protein
MMSWFFNWLLKKLEVTRKSTSDEAEKPYNTLVGKAAPDPCDLGQSNRFSINVMPAEGGTIVRFWTYETKSDRENNKLYVIPEDKDFIEEFSSIVSMEMLRRV